MGEFFAVNDIDSYINAKEVNDWSIEKIADFEADLQRRGIT